MTTLIKSNATFLGKKAVSENAPLPSDGLLYLDFENRQFIRKTAGGGIFRTNKVADMMSFTRASNATYVGENGLLQYAAANEPVIEYDPTSGECKGLRVEYTATNRIANSQLFDAATWTGTGVVLTPNDAVAPDGNATAYKMIESTTDTTTPSSRKIRTAVTMDAVVGQPYTFSVWAKKNSGKVVQLSASGGVATPQYANFDLDAGRITLSTPLLLQANMHAYPNGWYRCSITINPTVAGDPLFDIALTNGNTAAGSLPSYPSSSSGSIYIWGAQAERAAGYTSYIPTSGAESTRDNDLLTTPTGWNLMDSTQGSFFVEVQHPYSLKLLSGAYQSLACAVVLDNGVEGGHYRLAYRTRDNMYGQAAWAELNATGGATVSANIPTLSPVSNSIQAAFCSFNTASLRMRAYDGQAWYQANPTAMPATLSRICIGRGYVGSVNWFTGHIKKFVYWAKELTDAEAVAFFDAL
ncbi:putative tail fiber protein [Klebsiella phage vB_KppS-Pokey]|nr:putative tail fiber protein [Klebsiella phage vB_KppS-Pokey]